MHQPQALEYQNEIIKVIVEIFANAMLFCKNLHIVACGIGMRSYTIPVFCKPCL